MIKSTKRNQSNRTIHKWNVYEYFIDTFGNVHVPLVPMHNFNTHFRSSWLHMMTEHSMYLVTDLERRAWEAPDHIISPKISFPCLFWLFPIFSRFVHLQLDHRALATLPLIWVTLLTQLLMNYCCVLTSFSSSSPRFLCDFHGNWFKWTTYIEE